MTALNELSLDDARKFVNNGDVTSLGGASLSQANRQA